MHCDTEGRATGHFIQDIITMQQLAVGGWAASLYCVSELVTWSPSGLRSSSYTVYGPKTGRRRRAPFSLSDPGYMSRKIRKFRKDKFDTRNKRKFWLGWEPAVYMSYMSQNFRLFLVSNLSVQNFRIFLLMYSGSLSLSAGLITGQWSAPRDARERPAVGAGRGHGPPGRYY